jgi:hypothetical protein
LKQELDEAADLSGNATLFVDYGLQFRKEGLKPPPLNIAEDEKSIPFVSEPGDRHFLLLSNRLNNFAPI